MSNFGIGDYIITVTFIYFAVFYIAFSWLFSQLSASAREKLLKLLFITSPIWLAWSVYQLYARLPTIFARQIDFITDISTFLGLFLIFSAYLLLANWPATSAFVIIRLFRYPFFMETNQARTFWSLLETVKKNRARAIAFLVSLLTLVLILSAVLLFQLGRRNFFLLQKIEHAADTPQVAIITYIGLIIFFFWLLRNLSNRNVVGIPETGHKRAVDLRRAIGNISVAAGADPPRFKILAHNNPTSFSLSPGGKPTIYVTSGMLNLTDQRELEAVIGHEIAHIQSGRNDDYSIIDTLLTLLRVFGFVCFLLVLAMALPAINPVLILLLFAAILNISVKSGKETVEWDSGVSSVLNSVIAVANPPFSLINFLSFLIYYALARSEEYYADLKSVQFTRFPAGLYSALTKIETFKGFTKKLPRNHFHLYFAGERVASRNIPQPQPAIKNRKMILEDIDRTLKNFKLSKKNDSLVCPYCSARMQKLKGKGYYGRSATIDRCPKCGSVWFDNWELYYIADLAAISAAKTPAKTSPPDKLLCPRCGIKLSWIKDPAIPKNIQIWNCASCKGKLLEREEVAEYGKYKKRLKAGKKR